MKWLIEQFFGHWECVVAHDVGNEEAWILVCHKHTVTGRVKGYVDMGRYPVHQLEKNVVLGHIKKYGKSNERV